MSDTPETQPVEGAEILKLLRQIDAQARANGESLTKCVSLLSAVQMQLAPAAGSSQIMPPGPLTEIRQDLSEVTRLVSGVAEVVEQAAPLLQSRAAKALRGGSGVLDFVRGGRSGG